MIRQCLSALNESVWGNRLKIALCTVLACLCLFLASSFVLGVARTWHDNTICGGKSQTACIQHRRAQRVRAVQGVRHEQPPHRLT